jgi:putative DNA primase/helicase
MRFIGLLSRGEKKQVLANTANVLILLDLEPELRGLLGFDDMLGRGVLMRSPPFSHDTSRPAPGPFPRPWEDDDVQMILSYLQRVWTASFTVGVVERALGAVARQHPFHPILDYLARLAWDGKPRINTWLTNVFDTPDSAYARAVGTKFLLAAARRVREPGCKYDHMPIFEGDQGLGKSAAIAALFGASYFTDGMPADIGSRDAAMALHGVWAAEFPEIDQIIRADVETVKAFLSRAVDRYRVPYGRGFIGVKRQCVVCGTTNRTDYLRDVSGNRRFWPIECKTADKTWVEVNRDQLWAEAAVREANGESIWLDDEEIAVAAVEMQRSRLTEDTWQPLLADWLFDRLECTTANALSDGLGVPRERHDRKATVRATDVLRKLGWVSTVTGRGADSRRVWRRK